MRDYIKAVAFWAPWRLLLCAMAVVFLRFSINYAPQSKYFSEAAHPQGARSPELSPLSARAPDALLPASWAGAWCTRTRAGRSHTPCGTQACRGLHAF